MQQDINDILVKQVEKQQLILNNSISTISNIVKDFQKTIKFVVVINAISLAVILGTLFISHLYK